MGKSNDKRMREAEAPSGEDRVVMPISLTKEQKHQLQQYALDEGLSAAVVVRMALRSFGAIR